MTNTARTMLYIGVTNELQRRTTEHKQGIGSVFTKKYHLTDLIYFETFSDINQAIAREKQLKNWHKDWKWNLVKEVIRSSKIFKPFKMLKQVQHDVNNL